MLVDAVKQQPWLRDFTCEGHLAGTVLVHPHGVGTPPFAVEYSQVCTPRLIYILLWPTPGWVYFVASDVVANAYGSRMLSADWGQLVTPDSTLPSLDAQ